MAPEPVADRTAREQGGRPAGGRQTSERGGTTREPTTGGFGFFFRA